MIGVVRYSGASRVCEHAERERITAALVARVGALVVCEEHPELRYRDVKQHERRCLPSEARANNQRRNECSS